jgi:hypothetical protein
MDDLIRQEMGDQMRRRVRDNAFDALISAARTYVGLCDAGTKRARLVHDDILVDIDTSRDWDR